MWASGTTTAVTEWAENPRRWKLEITDKHSEKKVKNI